MNIDTFLSIGIVGVAVSLTMQLIKTKFKSKGLTSKAIIVALAIVGGTFIYFFSQTPYWTAFIGVLGTASTLYAFIIKK